MAYPDLVIEDMEDELIVYDPRSRQAHVLDTGASAVLLMCDGRTTIADMVDSAAEACQGPPEAVEAALRSLLEHFVAKGLLEGGDECFAALPDCPARP